MTADPRPLIEPDTLRGARSLPLTAVTTRRRTDPQRHSPFRALEPTQEQPAEGIDRFTAVAYDDDPESEPTTAVAPPTRPVDTLNLDLAARDADIAVRYLDGAATHQPRAPHGSAPVGQRPVISGP